MTEPSTTEVWIQRVESWRASGERAETFSRREGYAASTLRWWSSKLKREMAQLVTSEPSMVRTSEVRLARVVRSATPSAPMPAASASSEPAITVELMTAGVRIGIEPGVDRATLAMVLEVLRTGR